MRRIYFFILIIDILLLLLFAERALLGILIILLVMPVVVWLLSLYASLKLTVSLEAATKAQKNQEARVLLRIKNPTKIPILRARVKISAKNSFVEHSDSYSVELPIAAKSTAEAELMIAAAHCGCIEIAAQSIVSYDILLLTWFKKRLKNVRDVFISLPSRDISIKGEWANSKADTDSLVFSEKEKGKDISQVFDYHEYQTGDRIKNINWKISTRLDRLMVKSFSEPLSACAIILLELALEKLDLELLDDVINAAASISYAMTQSGAEHYIEWYSAASGSNTSERVGSPEAFDAAMERLLYSRLINEPLAIRAFEALSRSNTHMQIYYVTAMLNEGAAQKLRQCANTAEVTVLYLGREPVLAELEQMLLESTVNFFDLRTEQYLPQ